MKRALPVLLLFAACATAPPPAPRPVDEQTRTMIEQLTAALAQRPAHPPWIYVLAQYQDRAGNAAEVARWLGRLDELEWDQGANRVDFRNTAADRAVRAAMAKLDARQPRVNRARPAFTLRGQRDLVPEGIAYDPVDDVFYLSSIHLRKVVRVDRTGAARDFVAEGQDGMLSSLGMKVDARRRLLWVISTGTPEMRGSTADDQKRSLLAAYDLRDGRLVKKIEATPALLNDLTLLSDESLFATDMGRQKVVRLAPGANALEDWADDFGFPNGIAVSEDERFLYVADFRRGLTRLTIADRTRQAVETRAILSGIDGLSAHGGKLIGIQNAVGAPRVIRIDPESGAVEVLESKNALFELPLTGAVVGDEYWFIANPGLRSMDKPEDPVMVRLKL